MWFFDQVLQEKPLTEADVIISDAEKKSEITETVISSTITLDDVPNTAAEIANSEVSNLPMVELFDESENISTTEVKIEEALPVSSVETKEPPTEPLSSSIVSFSQTEREIIPSSVLETTLHPEGTIISLAQTVEEMLAKIKNNEQSIQSQIARIEKEADQLANEQKRLKWEEKMKRDEAKTLESDLKKAQNLQEILKKELLSA